MIGKYIYLEFLTPINDYIETIKTKEAIYDWMPPLFLSVLFYVFIKLNSIDVILDKIIGPTINFLAILIGFSVACISVLSTNENKNIKLLKNDLTNRRIGNIKISLYQLILITYIFSVIIEFFTLFINLSYLFIGTVCNIYSYNDLVVAINIFLLMHIILLNIRNITNFYFVFWKNK